MTKHSTKLAVAAALLLGFSAVHASPMLGTISSADNFSVIHTGSNPGGTGEPTDWSWFMPDQTIQVGIAGDFLVLDGIQSFDLFIPGSAEAQSTFTTVTFHALTFSLDDDDGFAGGSIVYEIDGGQGLFSFANANFNSIFNSSSRHGNFLDVFAWGGDEQNNRGMDLALRVLVPEPGMLALLLFGLGAMAVAILNRRRLATIRG